MHCCNGMLVGPAAPLQSVTAKVKSSATWPTMAEDTSSPKPIDHETGLYEFAENAATTCGKPAGLNVTLDSVVVATRTLTKRTVNVVPVGRTTCGNRSTPGAVGAATIP